MRSTKEVKHYKKLQKVRQFDRHTSIKRAKLRDFKEKKLGEEMNEVNQEYFEALESGELANVQIQKTAADLMERAI